MRSSNHSPLDSTGSAAESTISSAVNDESNHAISNAVDSPNELDGKDADTSSTMMNETSSDDITKASAIDASSTNEDDDSGKLRLHIISIPYFYAVFQIKTTKYQIFRININMFFRFAFSQI